MGDVPSQLSAEDAWVWWRALMENIVDLLEDADALVGRGSAGRALSLVVLACEELGKAVWVYRAAHAGWDGHTDVVLIPADFERLARKHPPKLRTAKRYASWLEKEFTGEWPARDDRGDGAEFAEVADHLNDMKQAGFYVDWKAGALRQPGSTAARSSVVNELEAVARAAHLLYDENWMRAYHATRPISPPIWDESSARATCPSRAARAWRQFPGGDALTYLRS